METGLITKPTPNTKQATRVTPLLLRARAHRSPVPESRRGVTICADRGIHITFPLPLTRSSTNETHGSFQDHDI